MTPAQQRLAMDLMAELAIASEVRGRDAGGFAALCANGELIARRQPGPAGPLFRGQEWRGLRQRRILMAIGHTRLATHGAPAINGNNHPHLAGEWALVHNGCIPYHEHKARRLGVRLHSQCDSEILVHVLRRWGERKGPLVCQGLCGSQSVLAINAAARVMLAWSNGLQPLAAFRVDGLPAVWFASTLEIATGVAARLSLIVQPAQVETDQLYRLEAP